MSRSPKETSEAPAPLVEPTPPTPAGLCVTCSHWQAGTCSRYLRVREALAVEMPDGVLDVTGCPDHTPPDSDTATTTPTEEQL